MAAKKKVKLVRKAKVKKAAPAAAVAASDPVETVWYGKTWDWIVAHKWWVIGGVVLLVVVGAVVR